MNKQHAIWFGPLMMVLASILFATGGLLCKILTWSALSINGVRGIVGGLLVGLYLLLTHHRLKFNLTIFIGAVCMFGVTTLFVLANKLTTAANAIVLQYTAPIWIILLMAIFFKQKPKRLDLITIFVVIIGILCFFFDSIGNGGMPGNIVAVLAGLCYAGLFLMNSTESGDLLSSLFYGQFFGGLLLLPFVFRETEFTASNITIVILMGLFQVGLAYILFNLGTKYTSPVSASVINGIEPVLNPILVAVFWGEVLTPLSLLGAAIVILAILIYNLMKIKKGT